MVAPTLRDWLKEGPFGLAMSSGFFAFFAHTGVLSVLEDEGLLPSRVSGSSAGALVTASWAAGVAATTLEQTLMALHREDFWDPRPGLGLLRGALFRARLEALLPAQRFEECRVPVAISVFDALSRRTRVMTAGNLPAAVHASCAVPLLFHPVRIGARVYVDGGVADRPGILGMPEREGERVLFHHIASRSPWRRRDGDATRVPSRDDMVSLVIEDLPRSGPFALGEGRKAFAVARRAARRALDEPVHGSLLRVFG
ncbi:MAG: patatin-like phospholipase family protein [Myxococcales bacterium]|nr:patatin-like phospholipase family protein [Myxococcales bacterium]